MTEIAKTIHWLTRCRNCGYAGRTLVKSPEPCPECAGPLHVGAEVIEFLNVEKKSHASEQR